jgi:hypothetical protein
MVGNVERLHRFMDFMRDLRIVETLQKACADEVQIFLDNPQITTHRSLTVAALLSDQMLLFY